MSGGSPFLVPPGDGGLPRRSGKTTRSRSGCIICRARKVKCDERPGTCLNCDRLSISCSGYGSQTGSRRLQSPGHTQAPNGLTKAGTARRRIHSSCGACRSSKTRCSGEKPRCLRCIRKDLDCLYKSVPAPAWIRNTLPPPSSPTEAPISLDQCTDNAATDQTALLPPSNPSNLELPSRFPYDAQTPTPEPRSMSAEMESQTGDSFSWLLLPTLPENEKIFELVEEYFTNIHHLRCLAFIHKPSFIQKLEEELPLKRGCSSLLYIICALGAKFYCLRRPGVTRGSSPEQIFLAGNEWAEEAKRLCYSELNTISMENLMASVLLHDHEIRIGNYSSAFTLSGACVRMAQALQLNLEYSADILCTKSISSPSPCSREARRRLMWSIYVMDSWVGSGVDQLTLLNDFDLKIQLPCHERNFNLQIPGITETLEEGNVLPFIPQHQRPPQPKDNMGLMAYFARLVCIRKKVLRHVKHLAESQMPWLPESEFGTLVASLKQWRDTLPDNMDFSTATIYTRKESSQLGGLCLVHCTYQHTLVDLYRIGLPKLFKIRAPVYFPHEQQDFLQHLQYCCFIHAREIATIIKLTAAHGTRMLADTWIVVVAHESLKVMLYYLTNVVDSTKYDKQAILDEIMPLLQSNVRILKLIAPMFATAKRCYASAFNMLKMAGLGHLVGGGIVIEEDSAHNYDIEGTPVAGSLSQESPDNVLNPLAIYRLVRTLVTEKHVPKQTSPRIDDSRDQVSPTSNIVMDCNGPPYEGGLDNSEQHNNMPARDTNSLDMVSLSENPRFVQAERISSFAPEFNFNDLSQQFPILDFGGAWEPPDATFDGVEIAGLPSWASPWEETPFNLWPP